MTKMTKREMYAVVINIVEASNYENKAEAIAFLNHEIELLNRKSERVGLTKTQKENIELSNEILIVLCEAENPLTVSQIMEKLPGYSNQKLTALLRGLVKENKVVRTEEKKKAYFFPM